MEPRALSRARARHYAVQCRYHIGTHLHCRPFYPAAGCGSGPFPKSQLQQPKVAAPVAGRRHTAGRNRTTAVTGPIVQVPAPVTAHCSEMESSDGALCRLDRPDATELPHSSSPHKRPPDNGQRASRAVGVWSTPGRGCRFPGRFVESSLESEISTDD